MPTPSYAFPFPSTYPPVEGAGLGPLGELSDIGVLPPTGDPSTDTASLLSGVTRLNTAGGSANLVFGEGTYVVNSNKLVIQSCTNFSVSGSGAGTIIQQAPNTTVIPNNTSGDILVIADSSNFFVTNLTCDGNRDVIAPITSLSATASSGASSVTVAAGSGVNYTVGQEVAVFGGLYANGGTAATNVLGNDVNFNDQNLVISSIEPKQGTSGGDLILFGSSTLSHTYTALAGYWSDPFGPFAGYGAYITPYLGLGGSTLYNTVAGRSLAGEDQQNGIHLLNCQRFTVTGCTSKNIWMSGIKAGSGFRLNNASINDACSDGVIAQNLTYHGYDQGVSVWLSQRISLASNISVASGWAGVSITHSDNCECIGNDISYSYYRVPNDANSGSGFCIEGGTNNICQGNTVYNVWSNSARLDASPLTFGVNVNSPPVLSSALAIGTAPGTSIPVSSSSYAVGATYCIIDAERTEKVGIASIVDSTHVTFDRVNRYAHPASTTVASGSNTVNVNTFTGTQTLNVASTTGYATSGTILVQIGSGTTYVSIAYEGTTATTFTNCYTLNSGAGALATGGLVGIPLTVAVATDTTFSGNNMVNPQTSHNLLMQSQARAFIKDNLIQGAASLTTQGSQFGFGLNMSEGNLHIGAASLGGEGSYIDGNDVTATNNEGIYLNGVRRVVVRNNLVSQPLSGSNCIHESAPSDYNRIENNIIEQTATATMAWVGANTQVRNNQGVNPFTVTAPTFPTTTSTYTNTTGVDVYAYIQNGTAQMTTTVNGNTGPTLPASTLGTVFIPAAGTFVPTYASGTPTWHFQGN